MLSHRPETIHPFAVTMDFQPPEALTQDMGSLSDEQRKTIDGLLIALSIYHPETYYHVLNTATLYSGFTQYLKIPNQNAILQALLHDIGKLRIPKEILTKPGKLTDEEFAIIKTHPEEGIRTVSRNNLLLPQEVEDVILQHHEKWNGSGYPMGLAGEEISPDACILAICDVFEAMTAPRCYKDPFPPDDALDQIFSLAGKHYDPIFVHFFVTYMEEQLNKGQELTLPIPIPAAGTIFSRQSPALIAL